MPKLLKISWMFFILQPFAEVFAVNIEFDKTVSYCEKARTSTKLFDGDKTPTNFEPLAGPCEKVSVLDIHMKEAMGIHYVIVFEGTGNDDGQLDYFIVHLSKNDKHQLCSEYPGTVRKGGVNRGMRVNCPNVNLFHQDISIESRKNIGFKISEIEVHSLALTRPRQAIAIYRGCFKKFGSEDMEAMFLSCDSYCLSKKKLFAGKKGNKLCACSNIVNTENELPLDDCNVTCDSDESRFCGGERSYAVYLIKSPLPYHVSCVKDSEILKNDAVTANDMTVAKCLFLCENEKFAFLQNGDTCSCKDERPPEKDIINVSELSCTTKCTGDPNIACGGKDKGSLYATCLTESDEGALKCSELLHCAGPYDMYGDCGGECKTGFTGDHCLERAAHILQNELKEVLWAMLPYAIPCLLLILIVGCLMCQSSRPQTTSSPSSPSSS